MEKINIDSYFICNHCNNIKYIKTYAEIYKKYINNLDIDILAKLKCEKCNEIMEKLDTEIFPIIKSLNDKGYKTLFSCQGHSMYRGAYIIFDKEMNDILKLIFDTLKVPDRWYKQLITVNKVGDKNELLYGLYSIMNHITFLLKTGITIDGKKLEYEEEHQKELDDLKSWVDKLPNLNEKLDILKIQNMLEELSATYTKIGFKIEEREWGYSIYIISKILPTYQYRCIDLKCIFPNNSIFPIAMIIEYEEQDYHSYLSQDILMKIIKDILIHNKKFLEIIDKLSQIEEPINKAYNMKGMLNYERKNLSKKRYNKHSM